MKAGVPKTLTPISGDNPLLHFILTGLEAAGITNLLVVTGFKPGPLQSYVNEHWNGEATFIFNARYASWGNFHSARLAVDQSPQSDLLIVNSDIVVHPDVFRRAAAAPGDLVLAVQDRDDLTEEDMRVQLGAGAAAPRDRGGAGSAGAQGRRVVAIGKDIPMAQSHGEFCGVSLLRPAAARAFAEVATDLQWQARTSLYYEDIYAQALDGLDARAVGVGPDEYAEVDRPEDLAGAAAVVEAHPGAWQPAGEPTAADRTAAP